MKVTKNQAVAIYVAAGALLVCVGLGLVWFPLAIISVGLCCGAVGIMLACSDG